MSRRLRITAYRVQPVAFEVPACAWDAFTQEDPAACVASYLVQPVAFVDDGVELTSLPIMPMEVRAAEWEKFVTCGLAEATGSLQAQIEAADVTAESPTRSDQPDV